MEQRIANKYGRSTSRVAQARSFAKMVDRAELEQICKLRNSKGGAFGKGLVAKILSLKKRSDRDRFLHQWQKNSWSANELGAAIKGKFGKSGGEGRKSKQPVSLLEALAQIHERCTSWVRWYNELADTNTGKMSLQDLPKQVRAQLDVTLMEIKKLQSLTGKKTG